MRNRGALGLEPHGDAAQRSARAHRADEAIQLAAGLRPDFFRRRLDMSLPVGNIVELVGPDGAPWERSRRALAARRAEYFT